MEDILYDYHLAQALAQRETDYQSSQKDRTKYFYAVLAKHDVTEADFDSSMVYYYGNIPELQKIYQRVEDRMDNEAAHLGATVMARETTISANGDTVNVWKGSGSAVLIPVVPYNRMDFDLKVDTSYHKGDEFLMSFSADFLYQSGTKDAVVFTAVTFDNDSTAQYYTHVTSSGLSQLRIPSNFSNSIRKIVGFIYLAQGSDDSSTTKLMFIDGIRFLRYHKKEVPKPAVPSLSMSMPKPDTTASKAMGSRPSGMPPMVNGRPLPQKPER